jgi:hypothetical protein
MVQSILTEDFSMKCISLKVVPNLLPVEQKQTCLAIARGLLQCADKDANFMKTVIIGDDLQSAGTTWKQEHSHHIGRLRCL